MPGMSEPRIFPRREAAPIKNWETLSSTQHTIIRQIHTWLTNFLANRHQPDISSQRDSGGPSFLPWLDEVRMNNVLLLNGGRGTGKTTLLLTLLHLWNSAIRDDGSQREFPPGLDENVKRLLSTRRIVPLKILDLQPLAKQHSLLLQLAGRLYEPAKSCNDRRDGFATGDEETSVPARAWLDFARAVAIGHEDDPRKRLASSNPEDFAIELETAERRQMNIGGKWSALVDSLVAALPQKSVTGLKDGKDPCKVGKDPCFVIPIDDADMNPERGVELIELLRSLWHPRVVFLMTGDIDLLSYLLFNHYKKVCERLPDAKARQLAADVLAKVIPPHQRWKSLPSEPIGYNYLAAAGVLPAVLQKKVKEGSLESAFPQRWRVLVDLERALLAQHLGAVEVTRVLFEEALRDSFLSDEQRRLLDGCFQRDRSGNGVRVRENVVQMRPVSKERAALLLDADARCAIAWNVSKDDIWILRTPERRDATSDEPEELPDGLVQSLYLASSLASEAHANEPNEGPVYTRSGRALSPSDYALISSTFGFASVRYEFSWPMPDWPDPIPFRCFVRSWRKILAKWEGILSSTPGSKQASGRQHDALEVLAAYWLSTFCAIGERGTVPNEVPSTPTSGEAWRELWRSLGERIAALAKSTERSGALRGAFIDWAQTDAMFFASKESGLRIRTREAMTEGWLEAMCPLIAGEVKDERYWELVEQVMGGRVQRIERASAKQGPIEDQINQAKPLIRARSVSMLFQQEVTNENPIPKGLVGAYQISNPVAAIATLMDGMDPSASGTLERQDLFAHLFLGIKATVARKLEHFGIQARLRLSKAKLSCLPSGLVDKWDSLWTRLLDRFDTVIMNMAAETSLLSDIINLDARDATRAMLRTYVKIAMPSLVAGIEEEMDRVERLSGLYPIPSATVHETFKTQLTETDRGSFSLYVASPRYQFGQSEEFLRDFPVMNQNTALVFLSTLRDIVVDQNDSTAKLDVEPTLDGLYLTEYQAIQYIIPVPVWICHHDNQLLKISFDQLGDAIGRLVTQVQPQTWMAGFLISSVLLIRDSRGMNSYQMYMANIEELGGIEHRTDTASDGKERFWTAIRKLVKKFYEPSLSGHRAAAVREWASLAGPLFAAPETGMTSADASKWLHAWDSTDNDCSFRPK